MNAEATVVNQRVTPKFFLKGVSSSVAEKVFPLSSNTKFGSTKLGRDSDCHIVINDPGVSRQHAAFHVEEGAVWLEDLDSANGTYVNQVSISKQEIYPGDLIAFNKVQFKLEVLGDVQRSAKESARNTHQKSAPVKTDDVNASPKAKSWRRILLIVALLVVAGFSGYVLRDLGQ